MASTIGSAKPASVMTAYTAFKFLIQDESDIVEGDMVEGDMVEGDMVEGDMVEGDMVEGDMDESNMDESNMANFQDCRTPRGMVAPRGTNGSQ